MIHLPSPLKKRTNKIHVSAACINCKKAHLACDVSRPCQRCISTDKADTCRDIQHKKRGRPKMLRDANNNKIRPTPQQKLPLLANQQQSKPAILPPDLLLFSSNTTTANQDMMAIFLSMDLCCARVSDKSFQYLELYPQEFSHRSLYDFLVPGESRESLAKLHRRLLNNASQSLMTTATTTTAAAACNFIRSSCDKFFSTPFEFLLTIANGSLTLKTILKFRGGLGTDLIESIDLTQLYIVCVATPVQQRVAAKVSSSSSLQYPPPTTSTTTTPSSSSSNDRFRYQPKPPAQQFIHPNELYYLQTTSSRMSMEAMAHTAYLSNNKSTQFASSTIGSGPLAAFNQHVNYKK
ncbi:MAG: hypothetical protein EXX96DRAFT_489018 [Benjaminiella poitrasii]|nr:MAG: hypothetical protein EXX96DRAFT_489018 [Benjaminiella poitrasii]